MTLGELFTKHGSDKDAAHSYGPFYDELLTSRRDKILSVLEVGIEWGGSLKAWREWLLPECTVYGMDHWANPGPIPGVIQLRCDSTNLPAVNDVLGGLAFDLIVDDGCHWLTEQRTTFANLWGRVRPNGLYVIEDLQSVEAMDVFCELGGEVFDRRDVKHRGDDILAVFHKPGLVPNKV